MPRRSGVSEAVAQPIGGTLVRVRRDWTARTRDTALNALRYSRFVSVMKRALPATAAALIAIVIVFSLLPRQSDRISLAYERMGKIDNDLASPRVCFQFSDPLARKTDFAPYVAVSGAANAAITTEDQQLCVEGLKHGERYAMVLRKGLPSTVGESLHTC